MKLKKHYLIFVFIITCLSACDLFTAAVNQAVEQTQTENKTATPIRYSSTQTKKKTASQFSISPPTSTPIQKEKNIPAHSLTIENKGVTLDVYGRVSFVGEEECPDCPYGYYSYLILDDHFYIISYDWVFYPEWRGDCIIVRDIVETFGSKPAFVFGGREAYEGSKCEYLPDGTLSCSEGDYFNLYSGCGN